MSILRWIQLATISTPPSGVLGTEVDCLLPLITDLHHHFSYGSPLWVLSTLSVATCVLILDLDAKKVGGDLAHMKFLQNLLCANPINLLGRCSGLIFQRRKLRFKEAGMAKLATCPF